MQDIIIIGGGIAGLYCAYKIKKQSQAKHILLLEANDHLGGRAGDENFHETSVAIGAGIGRTNKDKLLLKLLKELRIPYHEFLATSQYSATIVHPCNVKEMFLYLKKEYNAEEDQNKTFKQYAKPLLDQTYGAKSYSNFITCAGYTDYENESAQDTIQHYGFDDNYSSWQAYGLSWNQLIEKLASAIGHRNIKTSNAVVSIKGTDKDLYEITCKNKHVFTCKTVIMATTIESIMKLLPNTSLYQQIQGQPFLRIYGKFSKESIPIMKEACSITTVVPGPIHKLIPMDKEKGVYMIAYTDNKDAKLIDKYKKNTKKNRDILCRLLETALYIPVKALDLDDIVDFYWETGTHYYKPLKPVYKNRKEYIYDAQHPAENVRVIGEMISPKQGWVEGALESVEAILHENWCK